MSLPPLCLITDRHGTTGRPLLEVVEAALEGGVRMVQLREKDLPGRDLYDLAKKMRELTGRFGARLLINDRIDIALAVEADGVHLPGDSFPPAAARRLLGKGRLIGVSTHSLTEVATAEEGGADFITFSPIFETPSKAAYGAPQGLDRLAEVCRRSMLPIYALGGIKRESIGAVMEAGAAGVALISALLAAEDVRGEAERLSESLSGANQMNERA